MNTILVMPYGPARTRDKAADKQQLPRIGEIAPAAAELVAVGIAAGR